ncbi:hypothetical protein LCGC14_2581520 [marine sediment metagenome]|uniref:RNA polymerase sigma-70 region 2 domain-containing protein n=1 Tax=marine sediment metagenome TaxID=412755 RepID=A0A0F9AEP5_9ZZZZ
MSNHRSCVDATEHLRLVYHIANKVAVRWEWLVEHDDLVGWGMLGLVKASKRWTPDRGCTFATYATYRIRGQMMDAVEKELRMTRRRGSMPDMELFSDKRARADAVLARDEVESLLGSLSPRNASIMTMIYLDGLTLRETAKLMGLTESRICQIRKAAITKFRVVYLEEQAA